MLTRCWFLVFSISNMKLALPHEKNTHASTLLAPPICNIHFSVTPRVEGSSNFFFSENGLITILSHKEKKPQS